MTATGPPLSPVIWIGGTDGILRVAPDLLPELSPPPVPRIDFLDLGQTAGKSDWGKDRWTLAAHSKLGIHFSAGDFRQRQQLLYQTRLLDQTSEWSPATAKFEREFSYLWEGNYRFEVRTVGPSGLVSEPVSLNFRVLAPWYRSPWAYGGYLASLCLAVIGIIKWRHRAVLAQNRDLERVVRERTLELERTNAAKEEFVASISHEIRNPLNGVIGLAAALEVTELNSGQRHHLSMMRQCADHLSSLIEEILDFSRINAGEIAIESEPFDVAELLESARSVLYEKSLAAGIPIDLSVEGTVCPFLVGDKHRIRQILLNYIGNALNYAGRGRVTVSARSIPLGPSLHEVTFTVADQGPGIPSTELAELFAKFKRGSAARAQNVRGAGLGLAVCRLLAERMGGATLVQSEVGRGSFFHLRLTLAEPTIEIAAPVRPAEITLAAPAIALVVEDQEFNSAGLVAMLQRMGVPADVANSGEAALDRLAARRYSLIFADCDLPGMSGLEFASAVRQWEGAGNRIPIIATTAFATRQIVEECTTAGMDGFVSKPITLEKLRAAIASVLDQRRTAPSVRFAAAPDAPNRPYRLDTLRYIADGDAAEFERRLRAYIKELEGYFNEVMAAASTADFVQIKRIAHKLVGHLSVVEHAGLSLLAQQIEEAAVNRDLPEINPKLTEFQTGVRLLKGQLLMAVESVHSE